MSQSLTMARPYAKALFKKVCQTSAMHQWLSALNALSCAVRDANMRVVLDSPFYTDQQRQSILSDVVKAIPDFPVELVIEVETFLQVLTASNRLVVLPEIYTLFSDELEAFEGVVSASVASARALSEPEIASVKSYVEKTLGSKAQLTLKVDTALIGGVVIQVGSWVMDGSVRNRLSRLSERLRG